MTQGSGDTAADADSRRIRQTYRGPRPGRLRLWWMKRHGWRSVCWFCEADYAGSPCPTCGWAPLRRAVFLDRDGKRYTNEIGAANGDPWLLATICSPGGGRHAALPLLPLTGGQHDA